ncbi:MAG: hypothetical protein MUP16_11925 [Sedimentisphaerales bacterium]|nr:hypothetical protein [Sedimentisphaerales bacterium]
MAVHKAVILTVGVVIMLIAGCSEQNTSSEVRKSRLIAAQLKKQSEQLSKEIEEQKELLAKCLEEKKIATQPQESVKEQMDSLLTAAMEQNAELRDENEKLKMEIRELKRKK